MHHGLNRILHIGKIYLLFLRLSRCVLQRFISYRGKKCLELLEGIAMNLQAVFSESLHHDLTETQLSAVCRPRSGKNYASVNCLYHPDAKDLLPHQRYGLLQHREIFGLDYSKSCEPDLPFGFTV